MRIDEMILKANEDGKTYISYGMGPCGSPNNEYSKENGFVPALVSLVPMIWEEKPKRRLTVSEAEKELDCVIDVVISKLLRSPDMPPEEKRNVVAIPCSQNDSYTGYCRVDCFSGAVTWYKTPGIKINTPLYWIDPADLIKLLSKE